MKHPWGDLTLALPKLENNLKFAFSNGWKCYPPFTENSTYPTEYLNRGLLQVYQTLCGHGHSGGYDQLLFGRLWNLIDIKGWITDYARLVLKDQRNRNRSIELCFN